MGVSLFFSPEHPALAWPTPTVAELHCCHWHYIVVMVPFDSILKGLPTEFKFRLFFIHHIVILKCSGIRWWNPLFLLYKKILYERARGVYIICFLYRSIIFYKRNSFTSVMWFLIEYYTFNVKSAIQIFITNTEVHNAAQPGQVLLVTYGSFSIRKFTIAFIV